MDVHPTKNVSIGIDPYPIFLGAKLARLSCPIPSSKGDFVLLLDVIFQFTGHTEIGDLHNARGTCNKIKRHGPDVFRSWDSDETMMKP
jgi:hypothetical protein